MKILGLDKVKVDDTLAVITLDRIVALRVDTITNTLFVCTNLDSGRQARVRREDGRIQNSSYYVLSPYDERVEALVARQAAERLFAGIESRMRHGLIWRSMSADDVIDELTAVVEAIAKAQGEIIDMALKARTERGKVNAS
jgi:hypothetical protein